MVAPGSGMYDRTTKADTYAALGVRELWLVDLERREIEQRVLADGTWRIAGRFGGSTVIVAVSFPGLAVVPAELFPA